MKRFLLLVLTAGLLSPIAAKAERDDVRHICASMQVGEITPKQALRKIGLKVPKDYSPRKKIVAYCKVYLGLGV